MEPSAQHLLIGLDLGKVASRVVVCDQREASITAGQRRNVEANASPSLQIVDRRHNGEPFAPFFEVYRHLDPRSISGIVATGVYSQRLRSPVVAGLPEEIAMEWAVKRLAPQSGPLTVVRIGGSGFSVLTRTSSGDFRYEKNERCSAGTGETIERICGRLGATLEEASALAESALESVPITARCSVFAKSELTHLANQGEQHERLFRGYFESIAKNIHALVEKVSVPGPVWLVGHGALIRPLVLALRERMLTADPNRVVVVSPEAAIFEALGALEFGLRGLGGVLRR